VVAGFQVIIGGRFWVITEDMGLCSTESTTPKSRATCAAA
jgi:hypothetical protein